MILSDRENTEKHHQRVLVRQVENTNICLYTKAFQPTSPDRRESCVPLSVGTDDTDTTWETLGEAAQNLDSRQDAADAEEAVFAEYVANRGYHSKAMVTWLQEAGFAAYISEPARRRRGWKGKQ